MVASDLPSYPSPLFYSPSLPHMISNAISIGVGSPREVALWWRRRQLRYALEKQGLSEPNIQLYLASVEGEDPMVIADEVADGLRHTAQSIETEKSVDSVWLHCIATSTSLVQFYERCGFHVVSVLEGFYSIVGVSYDACALVYTVPPTSADVAPATEMAATIDAEGVAKENCPPRAQILEAAKKEGHQESCGAAAEAGEACRVTSASPAPVKAASDGPAGQYTRRPRPLSWLSPEMHASVWDISLSPVAKLRGKWHREWLQDTNRGGTRRSLHDSLGNTVQDVLLLCNAFVILGVVLWLSYNYGVIGGVH